MKSLKFMALTALMATALSSGAQEYYYSRQFDKAVENGTRTNTGIPGPNYRNNFAEYRIDASFDSGSAMLKGEETVVYHYNAGQKFNKHIVVNLYRNIYKKGAPRMRDCKPEDITDEGVEIIDVKQILPGGVKSDLDYQIDYTKMVLTLDGRINPGETVTLYIKWQEEVARNTHHRGGQYRTNSWMIPYWYPQVAVSDDLYGWDVVPHSDNEEFLQEFANYDVNLTIGGNMCVWATGDLLNASGIYNKQTLKNIEKASMSDNIVEVINSSNVGKVLQNSINTWHFKADSVVDFAFACSDSDYWDMSSIELTPKQKRTNVSAVYGDKGFGYVIDMTKATLKYLSTIRPAYPYPYSHSTIYEGDGGMEFPMMVNEDFERNYDDDLFTTSHEVMHSYCPFITGMYQNRFAFMDEGLTMYVPQYMQNEMFKEKNIIEEASRIMTFFQGSDDNVPVMTPSYSQTNLGIYTVNSYYKPQIAYTFLEEIVGEDEMSEILNKFVTMWAGKHPHPFDFFNLCESVSGNKLKEFFHSWFFTTDSPDLAITQVKDQTITIQNPGRLMVPIYLEINYADGTQETIERNALCWSNGNNAVNMFVSKPIKSLKLGKMSIPDIDPSNNEWSAE